MQSIDSVIETVREVLQENGHVPGELSASTNLLRDTPLDSMGLAVVVLRLEEKTGRDPFASGFKLFQTVGELADLYEP